MLTAFLMFPASSLFSRSISHPFCLSLLCYIFLSLIFFIYASLTHIFSFSLILSTSLSSPLKLFHPYFFSAFLMHSPSSLKSLLIHYTCLSFVISSFPYFLSSFPHTFRVCIILVTSSHSFCLPLILLTSLYLTLHPSPSYYAPFCQSLSLSLNISIFPHSFCIFFIPSVSPLHFLSYSYYLHLSFI